MVWGTFEYEEGLHIFVNDSTPSYHYTSPNSLLSILKFVFPRPLPFIPLLCPSRLHLVEALPPSVTPSYPADPSQFSSTKKGISHIGRLRFAHLLDRLFRILRCGES